MNATVSAQLESKVQKLEAQNQVTFDSLRSSSAAKVPTEFSMNARYEGLFGVPSNPREENPED